MLNIEFFGGNVLRYFISKITMGGPLQSLWVFLCRLKLQDEPSLYDIAYHNEEKLFLCVCVRVRVCVCVSSFKTVFESLLQSRL